MAYIYTIEQYNAISESIALGILVCEYSDKKVTYRSLNEMIRIQGIMEAQLGINKKFSENRTFVSFSNGMNGCNNVDETKYGAQ